MYEQGVEKLKEIARIETNKMLKPFVFVAACSIQRKAAIPSEIKDQMWEALFHVNRAS